MKPTLSSAIAAFGAKAKEKLANPAASGQPEDQLRTPFEQLLGEIAEISNFGKAAISAVGESSVSDLKTRPDFAVTVHNALVGFVELKAPGKGADPRKFKDPHDKAQWEKLHSLPGLVGLFERFLRWEPIPPRNAKELAHISARLCRLLRDEVTEQLAMKSEALTALAEDWR